MKICNKCGVKKSLEEFTRANWCKNGRRGECKACRNKVKQVPRDYHAERARALRKAYWPDLTNDQAAVEYSKLLEKQSHACAICEIHQSKLNRPLFVDHCHNTGRIRGLLCRPCNLGIGFLDSDSGDVRLRRALTYLLWRFIFSIN